MDVEGLVGMCRNGKCILIGSYWEKGWYYWFLVVVREIYYWMISGSDKGLGKNICMVGEGDDDA